MQLLTWRTKSIKISSIVYCLWLPSDKHVRLVWQLKFYDFSRTANMQLLEHTGLINID